MKTAWILKDNRAGNTTQTTALAEHLNLDYTYKQIEYNVLAKLPSFLLCGTLHINKRKSDPLDDPLPDVVISAGRRCAIIAQHLKSRKPSLKSLHIMRPLHKDDKFDYIILPTHDDYPAKPNVLFITGAINDTQNKIAKSAALQELYHNVKEFIGGVIGGNTRHHTFTARDNTKLVELIRHFLQKTNLLPVITFSRRTPKTTKDLIRKAFAGHIIYDPELDEDKPNIYYSILKSAKFVLCTGDSVSMCSEIASSSKPFYIYVPEQHSNKHMNFINQLLDLKIARLLEHNMQIE